MVRYDVAKNGTSTYKGFRVEVTEKWESGLVAGSWKSLGFRVFWKNDAEEGDSAELFRDVETARRHAETQIHMAKN